VPDLVVGVDAGATTTRCLVVAGDGTIIGSATAAGANIRSSAGQPEHWFAQALAAALGTCPPEDVRAGVFGVAGAGSAGAQTVAQAVDRAWRSLGLGGKAKVVTDLEVAFAAGSTNPDGLLLLAGTGAAAAAFVGRRMVRRCDGYGWVLGDEGSAVWLGLRGVRAALAAWDGRGEETRLRADLAAYFAVEPGADLAQTAISRVHADAPARLGEFAPLVTRAASAGDPVAVALVDEAAQRLVAGVRAVTTTASPVEPVDLVFAGAMLIEGPVRAAVLVRLDDGLRVRDPGPGAAGAAALALAELGGGALDPALHAAVLRAATATPATGKPS
jgi:glucosamine kinase